MKKKIILFILYSFYVYVCMFLSLVSIVRDCVKICKKEESLFGGLLAMEPTNIFFICIFYEIVFFLFLVILLLL